MATSMKQNNSDEVLLNSSSMSIAINETPKSNKGPLPDSPYDLPAYLLKFYSFNKRFNVTVNT
jgi:hypothetical protein